MISRRTLRLATFAVLVAGVVALYFTPLRTYMTREHVYDIVQRLRGLWYGPIVLIAGYAIGCVFAVPASIFILAAGVIWGWKLGLLYAMCGAMLGSSGAYFAGMFLGEGLLERFGRAGAMVSRHASRNGFVSILIARLIPGPPFAVWNYAAGITRMNFGEYFFGTLLGTLPSHAVFAYCADALFNGTMSEGEAIRKLAVVAGLLVALTLLTTILKRRLAPTNGAPAAETTRVPAAEPAPAPDAGEAS